MTLCNEPIRCWDNTVRGCRLNMYHDGGHNPFARPDTLNQDKQSWSESQRERDDKYTTA